MTTTGKTLLASNTGGVYRENPAGTADGILSFNVGGVIYTRNSVGLLTAAEAKLFPGSDMSSRLTALAANSAVKGIIFNTLGSTTFTFNSTVTLPSGFQMIFQAGNKFSGTGTINGGIIVANLNQQIMTTTLTWNPEGVAGDGVGAKWAGATGNGSTNDQPALQYMTDMVARNLGLPRDILYTPGTYHCDAPIITYVWNGVNYQACTVNHIGQVYAHSADPSNIPRVVFSSPNLFGFGFQRAYSSVIQGMSIEGPFNPSFASDKAFYESSFTTFCSANGSVVRDTQNSPCSGIVYDPFSFSSYVPADGGYPGYTSWYRGNGTINAAGSSHCAVIQTRVFGFCVNFMVSPNGQSQQCEEIKFVDCVSEVYKVSFAYGQRQTKGCVVVSSRHWDRGHTVIDTETYGNVVGGKGTAPSVFNMNLAGKNVRIFNVSAQHPSVFQNIYAESLGEIGVLASSPGNLSLVGCNFDFVTNTAYIPEYHLYGIGVKVSDSIMRYYDDAFNKRLYIKGYDNVFDNATFDLPPLTDCATNSQQANIATFIDCKFAGGALGYIGTNSYQGLLTSLNTFFCQYGEMQFTDTSTLCKDSGGTKVVNFIRIKTNTSNYQGLEVDGGSLVLTVNTTTQTATFTSGASIYLKNNMYAYSITGSRTTDKCLGRVTSVNTTTNAITLSNVPKGITTGSYTVQFNDTGYMRPAFIGNITNGSKVISGIEYSSAFSNAPYGVGTHCPILGGIVTASTSTSLTSTVAATSTVTGIFSGFGAELAYVTERYDIYASVNPNSSSLNLYDKLIPTNAVWINQSTNQTWIFTTGGFLNAAGQGKSHQAVFVEITPSAPPLP